MSFYPNYVGSLGGLLLIDIKEIDMDPDEISVEIPDRLEVSAGAPLEIAIAEAIEVELDG